MISRMDDLISRVVALNALDVLCQEHRYKIPGKRETYSQYNEAWQDALDRAEGAIGNLPSAQPKSYREGYQAGFKDAQPERMRGKWEFYEDRAPVWDRAGEKTWARAYKCSECGFVHSVIEDFGQYAFCPNCGAKMEVSDGSD